MALLCRNCNEKDFDEQVCKSCGVVNDEIQFGSESNSDINFKSFQSTTCVKKPRAEALNHGIDALSFLCHKFQISHDIKIETESLLKSVYASRRKERKSFQLKEDVSVLAACCLTHVQRKHSLLMPANGFCSALNCKKKKIFKMNKVLQIYLMDHVQKVKEEQTMESNPVQDSSFDDSESLESIVSSILTRAPEELIQKTVSLAKLADSCWLITGRSKVGVVSAAAYLCYNSMNPRNKLSLPQFCKEHSLNAVKARARIADLKNMLLKLGANIPSLTTNYVNEKNILFHLGYILENSESLRNDLLSEEFTVDAMNQKEFNTFRSCYIKSKPVPQTVSLYDDDMNASDIEISDSEINSYIRSDKQINLIQSLKNKQELQDSESE